MAQNNKQVQLDELCAQDDVTPLALIWARRDRALLASGAIAPELHWIRVGLHPSAAGSDAWVPRSTFFLRSIIQMRSAARMGLRRCAMTMRARWVSTLSSAS